MSEGDFPDLANYLPDAPAANEPSLLAKVVAGLQGHGRLVETDWDAGTFEVFPLNTEAQPGSIAVEPTVGTILSFAKRVVFYTVWPEVVPAEKLGAIGELAHRVNTELFTSAWEFNVDSGMLSVRSGFEFDGLPELTRELENSLAYNALLEVEAVFEEYAPAVAAVLAGQTPVDALAAVTS